ncbi:MAG: HlyD family efflux transporter periplasmic adaptor subunit [Bacteroidales bacterium]|nr:HlyD family efflux transporter periplasmic adaptor subunit [Bacteroidales bacterium]
MLTLGLLMGVFVFGFTACSDEENEGDASGSFEANELMLCALSDGVLIDIAVDEGQMVSQGDYLATIDSTQLVFQKMQINTALDAALLKLSSIPNKYKLLNDSILQLERKIETTFATPLKDSLLKEKQQMENRLQDYKATLSKEVRLLLTQTDPLYVQLRQINNAIDKCKIFAPENGTILNVYSKEHELVTCGRPLLRMANLTEMTLNAYVTENQLSTLKLGGTCTVLADKENGDMLKLKGVLTWIAQESEFTPKNINTKDVRSNLVYLVKIKVKNDGSLKTGMQGEVIFKTKP